MKVQLNTVVLNADDVATLVENLQELEIAAGGRIVIAEQYRQILKRITPGEMECWNCNNTEVRFAWELCSNCQAV